MHTYFTTVLQTHIENVHDFHHVLESGGGHVFPALVEAVYAVVVEILRNVTESYLRKDAVSAERMLNRGGDTYPGYCKFRTVLIFSSLNFA